MATARPTSRYFVLPRANGGYFDQPLGSLQLHLALAPTNRSRPIIRATAKWISPSGGRATAPGMYSEAKISASLRRRSEPMATFQQQPISTVTARRILRSSVPTEQIGSSCAQHRGYTFSSSEPTVIFRSRPLSFLE